MPKKDIDIIADELWWICKEYNGIPSQTVDKKAYSKALYILKTYGETPQIKAVIKEYNLSLPRTNSRTVSGSSIGIEEVKRILEERGRMPYCPIEKSLYCQVKYFFKKYSEYEEVKRLKVIYASGDYCPLYERDPENYIKKVQPYDRIIQSLDYIVMAFELYREFPAKNTIPMKLVRYLLENPSTKYNIGKLYKVPIPDHVLNSYLTKLINLGCKDEMVIDNWNRINKTNEL